MSGAEPVGLAKIRRLYSPGCRPSWGMSHPPALITTFSLRNNCRWSPATVSGNTSLILCSQLPTKWPHRKEVFNETKRLRDLGGNGEELPGRLFDSSTCL